MFLGLGVSAILKGSEGWGCAICGVVLFWEGWSISSGASSDHHALEVLGDTSCLLRYKITAKVGGAR